MSTEAAAIPAAVEHAAGPGGELRRRRPGGGRSRSRAGAVKGALFTLPFVAGFLLVYFVPVGYAVFQSLHQQKRSGLGFGPPKTVFSGIANYAQVFGEGAFWSSMARVVLIGLVQIPVTIGVALVMALLLDSVTARAVKFFRIGLLIPYVIPGIVAVLVWMYLYSPSISPITSMLHSLGTDVDFYSSFNVYLSVGNVLMWEQIGFTMILISASLQSIPKEYYEAARIDGASERRVAWSIKVPHVRPVLVLTGMFAIIGEIQLFAEPLILRQVRPDAIGVNFTPMQAIYAAAFSDSNYDYAAAMSTVLAAVTGIAAFFFYRFTNRSTDQ